MNVNNKLKRVKMRAEHRGIKEMDIILGGYVSKYGVEMSDRELDELESFMETNDQTLYQMILGNEPVPQEFTKLVDKIRTSIDFKTG